MMQSDVLLWIKLTNSFCKWSWDKSVDLLILNWQKIGSSCDMHSSALSLKRGWQAASLPFPPETMGHFHSTHCMKVCTRVFSSCLELCVCVCAPVTTCVPDGPQMGTQAGSSAFWLWHVSKQPASPGSPHRTFPLHPHMHIASLFFQFPQLSVQFKSNAMLCLIRRPHLTSDMNTEHYHICR